MREFAQYEMRKAKCPVCGCRNKLFTRFVDKITGEKVGFTCTCCNCGGVKEFFKNHTKKGLTPIYTRDEIKPTIQRCFQFMKCEHKECALYGTSCNKLASGKCFGNCIECVDKDCDTGNCSDTNNALNSNNGCSTSIKNMSNPLEVHIHNTPRFL